MQTEDTMSRMKKIGAFFAVSLLLVGCEAGKKPAQSASKQQPVNLTGTQWTLEEFGGKPVIEHSKATLAFLQAGRVSGNGSCNRFMGPAEMTGDKIKLGPLAGTKMMCDPGASDQETAYLKALESAQRFEVKDGKLLIYVAGSDAPLRFHAVAAGEK
jgi:heat shock protein HslJ